MCFKTNFIMDSNRRHDGCCRISIKVISWMFAIVNIVFVIACLCESAVLVFPIIEMWINDTDVQGQDPNFERITIYASIVFVVSIISTFFSLLLLIGLIKSYADSVKIYIVYGVIIDVISIFGSIAIMICMNVLYGGIALALCVIYPVFLVILYHTYIMLKESDIPEYREQVGLYRKEY